MNDAAPKTFPLSAVVAAPDGFDTCLLPDDFLAEIDGETLELIVVDGGESYSDRSGLGITHVRASGRPMYELANTRFGRQRRSNAAGLPPRAASS